MCFPVCEHTPEEPIRQGAAHVHRRNRRRRKIGSMRSRETSKPTSSNSWNSAAIRRPAICLPRNRCSPRCSRALRHRVRRQRTGPISQAFQKLSQDLKSGSLSAAQQDQSQQQQRQEHHEQRLSPSSMNELGSALRSGNLPNALTNLLFAATTPAAIHAVRFKLVQSGLAHGVAHRARCTVQANAVSGHAESRGKTQGSKIKPARQRKNAGVKPAIRSSMLRVSTCSGTPKYLRGP